MTTPRLFFPALYASLLLMAIGAGSTALAQGGPADQQDAALAYAQCVRDHGYAEFPDPTPGQGIRFLIKPGDAPRFQKAAAACRDIAPEGLRDDDISPQELDGLVKLAQCVRENGIPKFPDPNATGAFDLHELGIGPGDTRLEDAMAACRDKVELPKGGRIVIGG
jgi:hypothetical protein